MLFREEKAQPFFLTQLQHSQLITQKLIEDATIYFFLIREDSTIFWVKCFSERKKHNLNLFPEEKNAEEELSSKSKNKND